MATQPDPAGPEAAGFTSAVVAVTNAFGDPTRRSIYLFVREAEGGATASEVAAHFGLHANVARHHLDKLAAGGYVAAHLDRAGGAGRPSKRYRVTDTDATAGLVVRGDDLLLALLGRALARLSPVEAEELAEEVGAEYGKAVAASMSPGESQHSFRAALHAVADALTAHGFATHTEGRGSGLRLVSESCPFGDTAVAHPVVCAVDRGMVRGMLGALYGDATLALASSRPAGDEVCVTTVDA